MPTVTEKIRGVFQKDPTKFWTVAELLQELGEPATERKFFSSNLVKGEQRGEFTKDAYRRQCTVTWRSAYAYQFSTTQWQQTHARHNRQARNAKQTPPPPPTPPQRDPADQAAYERRKRIIEEEQRRRAQRSLADAELMKVANAKRTFQRYTKYNGRCLEEARKAYRQAAFTYHPDRGGDANAFAELTSAWEILKKIWN